MLSHFSLIVVDSQGTLHLILGSVRMHSTAASILAVTKISCSSYGMRFSDLS